MYIFQLAISFCMNLEVHTKLYILSEVLTFTMGEPSVRELGTE